MTCSKPLPKGPVIRRNVAAWLGLGTAGVAAAVVAMAWSVHARQIRLAERLARRQFPVIGGNGGANKDAARS